MLTAVAGYSFFPVFTKILLAEGMNPVDIGVWRFVIAVAVMWGLRFSIAARQKQPVRLPRLPVLPVVIMGVMMAVAALCGFFGMERLPTATFIVLFYTYPMMIALIGAIFGQRLPRAAWVALALTLLGIFLTAPDFSAGLQGDNLPGVLIAFANAFVIAIYFIFSGRTLKNERDVVGASALILTATLITMLIAGVLIGFSLPPTPRAWLFVIALALVGTVMPTFALNKGIPRLGAAKAGIVSSIEPLTSSILAMIFIGEIMTENQWLGGLVIVAGIIVLQVPALLARRNAVTIPAVPPA